VASGAGVNSTFVARVDPSLVKAWEVRLGPNVWYGLHHFCAGLAFAARAKSITDKTQRDRALQRAIEEYSFMYTRMPQTGPMRADVATRLGLAHGEVAKYDEAVRYFDSAILACAECEIGYLGKAMYLRGRKDLTAARDVLLQGYKATGGLSAQGNYLLGLLFADLLDFEAAREHARKAYELGYPLPGLRDRLAKAGYPL
jgi:tetratricopeptide (TPR) repeat protein